MPTYEEDREPPWLALLVKITVTIVGLLLLIKEASRPNDVRPELLFLYAWMIGLPGVFSIEQLRRGRREKSDDDS